MTNQLSLNTTQVVTKTKRPRRPRISKGVLVASTNRARIVCMTKYLTIYIFRPISYTIIKRVVVDIPLLN